MLDSDWFFLDRDFQYGNGLNGNGLKLLIFLFAKAGKFKICNLNYKKKPLPQRSYLKIDILRSFQHGRGPIFTIHYPEGVETSDHQTFPR